jgi:hypothetical protein
MSNLGACLLPAFIPIVGLGYFLFLWKGLTPPLFADYTARTMNWCAPIFIVSLVGLYGGFFFLELFEVYKRNVGKLRFPILLTALSAGYLLLHPVSNQYQGIGTRGGALWLAASHLPNLFNSSLLYWVLFPIGTVCLYMMIQELALNHNYVMVICFSLWFLTSLVNARTYQKFYEPFILFFLGYTMIPLRSERWFYWVGPAILLAGFIAVTFIRFF